MEGGMGPDCVTYVFVFRRHIIICQLYKLTLSDQAQITLQLEFALSKLVERFLISPPILGGPKPTFSTPADTCGQMDGQTEWS